jgi:hypothetical protein
VGWGDKLDWFGPWYRQMADYCKFGNEPSVPIKFGVFLD